VLRFIFLPIGAHVTRPRQRHSKQSPHLDDATARAPGGAPSEILILAWGGLAIYLVLFFLSPLSSAAQALGLFPRWRLLDSVFSADEICRQWIADCSWASLGQRATILALAGGIFAVSSVAGWTAMELGGFNRLVTRLESFVFSAGVGLNLTSLFALSLGLCGVLRGDVLAVAALAVLLMAGGLAWRKTRLRRQVEGGRSASIGTSPLHLAPKGTAFSETEAGTPDSGTLQLDRRWLWLATPFVLAIMLGAMLPPVDFDVLEYHLQAPKEFYLARRITFLPHNVYANMPLGAEMLSLVGMVAARDWWTGALVGKTLIAAFAPLTALALVAAGRRFATPAAGLVAALIYISIPWIALVSMQGLVEGPFAFYLLVSLYGVLLWQPQLAMPDRSDRLLALAGFLAGGAVSCKYPAVLYCVLPLAAWIAWRTIATNRGIAAKRSLALGIAKRLGIFLSFTALGCGPWFAKNAILTGNPTYPLLAGVFDGQTRTTEKIEQWNRVHSPPNYQWSDLAGRVADVSLRSDWLSPLVMPLAALALARRRERRVAWQLAAYFAFVFCAWWLLTHRIDRFWVPILSVVGLLAGIGATWTSGRWWKATLATLLTIGLFYNFVVITGGVLGDNFYLANLDRLRVDPQRVDRWHLYLNEHVAEVTGVLLVGDAQPFDLEVPVLYNTVLDDCIFEQLARGRTPEEIHAALHERHISHVLVAWNEIRRYRSPGNYGVTDFLQSGVFKDLVAAGVLAELPGGSDVSGQLFRVVPGAAA
jgi:hypothetical protein